MTLSYFMYDIEREISEKREKREDINRRMAAIIEEVQRSTVQLEPLPPSRNGDP
jgi:hypothetical protein